LAVGPEVVSVAGPEVSEPGVALAAVFVAEPEVVFVAVYSAECGVLVVFVVAALFVDVAEPRFSVDIPAPFAVSAPVSVPVVEVDSPARPSFFVFPSIDFYARSASFVEIVGEESVHNSMDARANCG